jgi:hypothetical protein
MGSGGVLLFLFTEMAIERDDQSTSKNKARR